MINPDAIKKLFYPHDGSTESFFIKSSPLAAGFERRIRKNMSIILKKGGNYVRESNRA